MVDPLVIPSEAATFPLDVAAATRAYLATLPPEARSASDAYFEGGYGLQILDLVFGVVVAVALLHTGASARLRDLAGRVTKLRPVHVALYWALYLTVMTVVSFPLEAYEHYFREHAYGLSNLSFAGWLGEQAKGFGVGLVLGALGIVGLYAILRRAKRTWWIWGAVAAVAFVGFEAAIFPVFIAPVFNHYTVLDEPKVTGPILSLARANGIPASEVFTFDASKQSKRVSANVSGFAGTERISLNDNLLHRAELPEIEAVMAHEMGHYVLHHVNKLLLEMGLVILVGFGFVRLAFERLRARHAERWRVDGIDDPAGLPLVVLLFSVYAAVASPVTNSIIRTSESEADLFGLNAARQPDGFAAAALQVSEYRKLDPGPLEELVFYDHPSGRRRIEMAMRWKAEHPELAR